MCIRCLAGTFGPRSNACDANTTPTRLSRSLTSAWTSSLQTRSSVLWSTLSARSSSSAPTHTSAAGTCPAVCVCVCAYVYVYRLTSHSPPCWPLLVLLPLLRARVRVCVCVSVCLRVCVFACLRVCVFLQLQAEGAGDKAAVNPPHAQRAVHSAQALQLHESLWLQDQTPRVVSASPEHSPVALAHHCECACVVCVCVCMCCVCVCCVGKDQGWAKVNLGRGVSGCMHHAHTAHLHFFDNHSNTDNDNDNIAAEARGQRAVRLPAVCSAGAPRREYVFGPLHLLRPRSKQRLVLRR